MYIAYFILFIIFNGRLTLEIAVFGAIFAALLYAFSCRFLGYSVKKDLRIMRGLGAAIRYGAMLVVEIVKANLMVIRQILTKGFEPHPHLVTFRGGLDSDGHRVALADSITLTPGTITCNLEGDIFTVHCLDDAQREGIEETVFYKSLKKMEEDCRKLQSAKAGAGASEEAGPAEIVREEHAAPAEEETEMSGTVLDEVEIPNEGQRPESGEEEAEQ